MRKIILWAAMTAVSTAGFAQASSTATQSITLNLSNAIALTFSATSSSTGASVSLPFSTVADYTNGVLSSAQQLKTQSNKPFNITVAAGSATFSYAGAVSPAPAMPVSGVLAMEVSANGTGGTVAPGFNNAFANVTSTAQSVISSGANGGNQLFSVLYQATPGFSYPSGSYTTNIVYTATQP